MKIKTLLQAPLILQKVKELNIDLTTLEPNARVKLKDGCLVFEGEKECFVSKAEPIETPLEICKRLYFEGIEFQVYESEKTYTIKEGFLIEEINGNVYLLPNIQERYTLYRKCQNEFVKIIEPSGNSEQLEYYYLKLNIDCFQKGDETVLSKNSVNWVPVLDEYFGGMYTNDYFPVRRKIQKNT